MISDNRLRFPYRMPDGRVVPMVFDEGQRVPFELSVEVGGRIVTATRVRLPSEAA